MCLPHDFTTGAREGRVVAARVHYYRDTLGRCPDVDMRIVRADAHE